jgi:hypothetical protein
MNTDGQSAGKQDSVFRLAIGSAMIMKSQSGAAATDGQKKGTNH